MSHVFRFLLGSVSDWHYFVHRSVYFTGHVCVCCEDSWDDLRADLFASAEALAALPAGSTGDDFCLAAVRLSSACDMSLFWIG